MGMRKQSMLAMCSNENRIHLFVSRLVAFGNDMYLIVTQIDKIDTQKKQKIEYQIIYISVHNYTFSEIEMKMSR